MLLAILILVIFILVMIAFASFSLDSAIKSMPVTEESYKFFSFMQDVQSFLAGRL